MIIKHQDIKNILVLLDGSEESFSAASLAIEMAKRLSSLANDGWQPTGASAWKNLFMAHAEARLQALLQLKATYSDRISEKAYLFAIRI